MCFDVCDVTLYKDAMQTTPWRGTTFLQRTDTWRRRRGPIQPVEVQGLEEVVVALHGVLKRKEGHVFKESQVAGTSMFIMKAYCSSRSPLLYRRPEVPQGGQAFP